ncbi:Uncharacterized protein TCM_002172 [Theobroma cacao]|uniref:Uncharacterized protein n=1 Tax=Theobroma cacao TaxID=3641 RepID=A0A061DKM1_THECC|nr:Uncharacterized protein TCM_002172 [Theobroma cacao]
MTLNIDFDTDVTDLIRRCNDDDVAAYNARQLTKPKASGLKFCFLVFALSMWVMGKESTWASNDIENLKRGKRREKIGKRSPASSRQDQGAGCSSEEKKNRGGGGLRSKARR